MKGLIYSNQQDIYMQEKIVSNINCIDIAGPLKN